MGYENELWGFLDFFDNHTHIGAVKKHGAHAKTQRYQSFYDLI
jgi:hypothetical protein